MAEYVCKPEDFIIKNGVLKQYTGSDTHVIIPDGVTNIAFGAFECCEQLKDVHIPHTVKEIDSGAFRRCENINNIRLPYWTSIVKDYRHFLPRGQKVKIFKEVYKFNWEVFGGKENNHNYYYIAVMIDGIIYRVSQYFPTYESAIAKFQSPIHDGKYIEIKKVTTNGSNN